MYTRLKERALRLCMREAKTRRTQQILFVSGVRSQESRRRMGYVEPILKEKGVARVWVAAIHDWSKSDCLEYLERKNVPRNPVAEVLHMSGECLCGAMASPDELKEINFWFPEVGAEIAELEKEARARGHNWSWGCKPPKKKKKTPKKKHREDPVKMMLCSGCVSGNGKIANQSRERILAGKKADRS